VTASASSPQPRSATNGVDWAVICCCFPASPACASSPGSLCWNRPFWTNKDDCHAIRTNDNRTLYLCWGLFSGRPNRSYFLPTVRRKMIPKRPYSAAFSARARRCDDYYWTRGLLCVGDCLQKAAVKASTGQTHTSLESAGSSWDLQSQQQQYSASDHIPVLNRIRFPDRDPTGFCDSEPDPDWISKKILPDQVWISKLRWSLQLKCDRAGLHNENIGLDYDRKNIRSVEHSHIYHERRVAANWQQLGQIRHTIQRESHKVLFHQNSAFPPHPKSFPGVCFELSPHHDQDFSATAQEFIAGSRTTTSWAMQFK